MSTSQGSHSGFAGLLRSCRKSAGLTQEELAERSGLTARAISDMERGKTARPHPRSVRLLADALGLPGPARGQLTAAARPSNGHAEQRQGHEPVPATGPGPDSAEHPGAGGSSSGGGDSDSGSRSGSGSSLLPERRPAVIPRQLPPTVRHFAGRAAELKLLNCLHLCRARQPPDAGPRARQSGRHPPCFRPADGGWHGLGAGRSRPGAAAKSSC